jgi:chromosome segregation ATPase
MAWPNRGNAPTRGGPAARLRWVDIDVDRDSQIATLQAELALRESFTEHLRSELKAARTALAEAEAERDVLRRQVAEAPRWREHAEALQEHIAALHNRASARVADRAYIAVSRIPGAAPFLSRTARTLLRG